MIFQHVGNYTDLVYRTAFGLCIGFLYNTSDLYRDGPTKIEFKKPLCL